MTDSTTHLVFVSRAQLPRLIAADLTKVRRSAIHVWLLGLLLLAFPVLAAPVTFYQLVPDSPGAFTFFAPGDEITTALIGGIASWYLLLPVFVAFAINPDGASGFDMLQAVAVPSRARHVLSKILVIVPSLSVLAGCVGVLALAAGRLVLATAEQNFTLSSPRDAALAAARLMAVAGLLAVIAVGAAYAIRNTGVTIGVLVFLLLIAPMLLSLMPALTRWSAVLPTEAGERFMMQNYFPPTMQWFDPGRLGSIGILAAWGAVAITIGAYRYVRTDLQHP